MSQSIFITGAAGGSEGFTGCQLASLLMDQGIEIRALGHEVDARSSCLHERGAEVVEADLLDLLNVEQFFRSNGAVLAGATI